MIKNFIYFFSEQTIWTVNKKISLHSLRMMNTVNTEFSYNEVWFANKDSKALEIEGNFNLTVIIG